MDRFQTDFPCTICHDYGSDECDCPRVDPKDATIARLNLEKSYAQDSLDAAKEEIARLTAELEYLKDELAIERTSAIAWEGCFNTEKAKRAELLDAETREIAEWIRPQRNDCPATGDEFANAILARLDQRKEAGE